MLQSNWFDRVKVDATMQSVNTQPERQLAPVEQHALQVHGFLRPPLERLTFVHDASEVLSTAAVTVFSFGIFIIGLSSVLQFDIGVWIGACVVVAAALIGVVAIRPTLLPAGTRREVLLYTDGFAYLAGRETLVLHWQDIDTVYMSLETVFGNRSAGHVGYRLTICPYNARSVTFYSESLPRCARLAGAVRTATLSLHWAELWRAHQAGEPLYFNALTLHPQSLATAAHHIDLDALEAIKFEGGDYLLVKPSNAKWQRWRDVRAHGIPNLHILLQLLCAHGVWVQDFDGQAVSALYHAAAPIHPQQSEQSNRP